jgi:hypothetical protein
LSAASALAAAELGVAMGAGGAAAFAEAADVVLLVDRLDLLRGIALQRRPCRIDLSLLGMVPAALGTGRGIQEVIDVTVILRSTTLARKQEAIDPAQGATLRAALETGRCFRPQSCPGSDRCETGPLGP